MTRPAENGWHAFRRHSRLNGQPEVNVADAQAGMNRCASTDA